jgi:hypothetical protein
MRNKNIKAIIIEAIPNPSKMSIFKYLKVRIIESKIKTNYPSVN